MVRGKRVALLCLSAATLKIAVSTNFTNPRNSCQLTMLARLLVYKAISCPGSLCKCWFTRHSNLCRLHSLSDSIASECKSVCSYRFCFFGRIAPTYGFRIAESLTSIYLHCRSCVTPIREALMLLARVAHSAWPFTLRHLWWRWRALPPRPAHINFSLQIAFQLSHDHYTAVRRKPVCVLHGISYF